MSQATLPEKFSQRLKEAIADRHLLKHPFYQDWMEGKLSMDTLRNYSAQYFRHVAAFPRYISATHSNCEDIQARKILLENLNDEEGARGENHPELWMRFAEGLGQTRSDVLGSQPAASIMNVVSTFEEASRSSYEEGLAALYAYEYQVPEVAETKIEGLKSNYGICDDRTLSFFQVHKEADVYHRQACESLLDQMPVDKQEKALSAAKKAADSLWNFLTEMHGKNHCAA